MKEMTRGRIGERGKFCREIFTGLLETCLALSRVEKGQSSIDLQKWRNCRSTRIETVADGFQMEIRVLRLFY